MKKVLMLLVGILILAGGGYFAYNYMTKEARQKELRAAAEAKQKDMKPLVKKTSLSEMNIAGMIKREQNAAPGANPAGGQPAAPGQPVTPGQPAAAAPGQPAAGGAVYNPKAGNPAAERQMAPDFASQKVPAPSASSISSGDAPVRLEDILSGKTVLSISFATLGDPTLSGDDRAFIDRVRQQRLQAEEAARLAKIEAERQARLAEEARLRELAVEARDPSRAIRNKIKISGIVDKEAFIGNKAYGVGSTVLGARIVSISGDSVVFSYKGQRFTKKIAVK